MMHYGPQTRAKRSEASPKGTNPEKGVILLVVLMVIIVVSIYLPAYVTWGIWDQRNLIRQQRAEEAKAIAQAGLDRAVLDLYLDADWLDGNINRTTVTRPDSGNPDVFQTLYNQVNLGSGNYTVEIDYLQNPRICTSGCSFLDKRMFVRSTGRVPGATVTLEQYVDNFGVVRNLTQNLLYPNLQPAITEAVTNSWDNNLFAISAATLTENVTISSAWTFNIEGCYDPTFRFRTCMDYPTRIQGNVNISGNATVNLTGVTID